MIAVNVTVVKDTATPAVNRMRGFLESDDGKQVIGYAARKAVRDNFQELENTRANKLGGARTHYYGSARRATNFQIEGDDVVVSTNQIGMRLHYFGGTVTAGKGVSSKTGTATRFLTIPATSEAYGKSAKSFDNLVLVWGRKGPYALARGVETNRLTRDGLRKVMVPGEKLFFLKEKVTLEPDPSVVPTQEQFSTVINKALRIATRKIWQNETPETTPDE